MKTIVWDMDDVLNPLMNRWLAFYRKKTGCKAGFADLKQNPPHEILGMEKQEYLDSLDEFRRTPEGSNPDPNPVILEWFRRHGDSFRHAVLTATPAFHAAQAASWVFTYFGRWVRCFGFVPSPRPANPVPEYFWSKGEFLQWMKAGDILVDDSKANVEEARAAGLTAVLFPRPWNDSPFRSEEELLLELASWKN